MFGEIVVICGNNIRSLNWPLGVIKGVFPGMDVISRVVRVKTSNGILIAPIQRVYSLEVFRDAPEVKKTIEKEQLQKHSNLILVF